MQLVTTKKIGKRTYTFICEGKNLHEATMESEQLSFDDVPCCGICKSDDLRLCAHVAQQKYEYTEIRCFKCRASVTFGQRKDNKNAFYLRKVGEGKEAKLDWKEFKPNGE